MEINLQYTTIKSPVPDFIYSGLRPYVADSNAYRPQPEELIEKLAQKHSVSKNMVFLTAGADEGIQMTAMTYGSRAYVFTPAYVVYTDVETFGGHLTRVYSIQDGAFRISPQTQEGATLIYLANPNNPSGLTDRETILKLIKNNTSAKVVIDEAYGGFHTDSVIDAVADNPNLIVLRSFSKDYGLAGARIGYMVARPEVIAELSPKTQWANVSYMSVGAAIIALQHEEYFEQMRKDIIDRRVRFCAVLERKGYRYIPSAINAVLLPFPTQNAAGRFVEHLAKHSVVVSYGNGNSNIGLDLSFVRLAIGTEEQMERVGNIIGEYASYGR